MDWRLWLGLALAGATAGVYLPVAGFEFVSLDDPLYITGNDWVVRGLDAESATWAFTSSIGANWLPLTFLSHMLDVTWFGLEPGGHHLTNLALHVAAVLVLFGVGIAMTGRVGRMAVIAALFALHPMHVESVAWVTGRKDVLSGLFAFLTIAAYLGYARRGGAARYLLVVVSLACGLMSKAMLVTLPFVLLLLDLWPLGRLAPRPGSRAQRWLADRGGAERSGVVHRPAPFGRLAREKLPLLALAAVSSAITFVVQQQDGAMAVAGAVAWPERLANAVYSYARYIELSLVPRGLSVSVPHPYLPDEGGLGLSGLQLGGSLALLAGLAVVAVRRGRAVAVGLCWFVGMLVPVIGIVQVGPQAMADRYSYLPSVGLYLAAVWPVADWVERGSPRVRIAAGALVVALLAGLSLQTSRQLERWRSSIPLFQHALAVNAGNLSARFALAQAYRSAGRDAEALEQYRLVLRLRPGSARAHNGLGVMLREHGDLAGAVLHFERALAIQPALVLAHNNLGLALQDLGELERAESAFREALRIDPDAVRPRRNLALLLRASGRSDEAFAQLRDVLARRPDSAAAHRAMAELLAEEGRTREAVLQYRALLELRPDDQRARHEVMRLESPAQDAP